MKEQPKNIVLDAGRKAQLKADLDEFEDFIGQYTDRAKALDMPRVLDLIGLLNALHQSYAKSLANNVDFKNKDEPIVALPQHLRYMEERLNAMLSPFASVRIRTIVEAELKHESS